MAVKVLCPLLGVLFIGLAHVDILATVMHPHIESPLSSRFNRLVGRLFGSAGRLLSGHRRHLLLGWGLPVMIAGLIAVWLLLLLTGFALLYYPWIHQPTHFALPAYNESAVLDALYFSGVALTTVGFGDIQALSWPLRFLAVGEAASGILVVSLSVAYLLAVYPALAQKRVVAVALDADVAGRPSALPMVRRYLVGAAGSTDELTARLRELARELVSLTESHASHPVLYFVHPPDIRFSFLRILVTVQSLVGLLRYGLSPDRNPIVRNPQLLLLEQALHYSLRQLTSSLHIPDIKRTDSQEERRRLAADYARLCGDLEALGLVSAQSEAVQPVPAINQSLGNGEHAGQPVARDNDTATDTFDPALDLAADSPCRAYLAFRLATDPHLASYAAGSGYDLAEAKHDRETTWERDYE